MPPTTFTGELKIHPFGGLTRINIERNFATRFNNISINRSERGKKEKNMKKNVNINRIFIIAVIGLMLGLLSCHKNDPVNNEDPPFNPTVYVAGYEQNANGISVAKLWKNGVAQNLSDGTTNAGAYSVCVFLNDVYVCGYETNILGFQNATLWKNGVPVNLNLTGGTATDISVIHSQAYSVDVFGGNVYVAGQLGLDKRVVLWKNGVVQPLPNTGNFQSCAYLVYVSGNNADVYVAGDYAILGFNATLWKNGEIQSLKQSGKQCTGRSVYVYGKDVYVAGGDYDTAVVWKNGVAQSLADGIAFSVFVSFDGSDVYVAGRVGLYDAVVWKNGVVQNLTDGSHFFSTAYSVFVHPNTNDVYAAGNDGNVAVVWKNGVAQKLTNGAYEAVARSVFVK